MKRKVIFYMLFVLFNALSLSADNTYQISIEHVPKGGTHGEQPIPDVEPTVYYDNDEREITIVGTGFASYYDVEIKSATTSMVYISTRVDGSYDTIDVSSLPNDDYKIVITTPYNNVYEGYFTNY